MTGILILDKPPGLSSARATSRIKRLLPRGTKIGHAGALDPFATGVLLLLIGREATRLCERLMGMPKTYEGGIRLGATTPTLDPEKPESPTGAPPAPLENVLRILPRFLGQIQQAPPAYSALKVSGRPAYELARRGRAVELEARAVHVYAIDLLRYEWPDLQLRVECGRGTYIRALARDIGEALGTGAYLKTLRRTRVGPFDVRDAATLDDVNARGLESLLRPTTILQ